MSFALFTFWVCVLNILYLLKGNILLAAKSQSCQGLCCYLLDLLQTEQLDFQVKMEVC